VQVHPNSRNVIPGRVKFSFDLRNLNNELLDTMDRELRAFMRNATERLGYSHMETVSGAGHDAVYVARLSPAGMIFVPCKDGISHNEIEDAKPEHLTAGCNILLHAMLERAGVI